MHSASARTAGPTRAPREAPTPAARSPDSAAWPVALLGIPFDPMTLGGAVARIEEMIASRQPHYVVTANVNFLVQARRDVELRRILLDADLVLCDGTPLVWASRWMGNALPERVAGSDLAPVLMELAAARGHRVFFLGAAAGVAADAAARLQGAYPQLNIVGHYAPPFADLLEMDHDQIVQRIREARPDLLLVSFGCPKQEKWIAMHHHALGVPVAIGVGATLDFLAGRVKRAPNWMRRSGTEWIYRLALEPRRLFRRYAGDFVSFIPQLAAQWCRLALRRPGGLPPRTMAFAPPEWHGIDAGASLTRESLESNPAFWHGLLQRDAHCLVDLTKVREIDATGVAYLVRWRKLLHDNRRQLILLAPSRRLRRTLAALKLTDYFVTAADIAGAAALAEAITLRPAVQRDTAARSLAWCGEIVSANAEDVWRMTTEHVRTFNTAGVTLVVVDLARLKFIDSSGAALMVRLTKWAQQLPVQVLFTNAHANVRNVLRLTRLDQLLLEGAQ